RFRPRARAQDPTRSGIFQKPSVQRWQRGGEALSGGRLGGGGNNRKELCRVERSPANKCTIDVGLGEEAGCVAGIDASAVLDPDGIRGCVPDFTQDRADERAGFLGYLGGCSLAGADRPDRFVGDREARRERQAREARLELAAEHRLCVASTTLIEMLANANDWVERRSHYRRQLPIDRAVRLSKELPAFTMTDDDV